MLGFLGNHDQATSLAIDVVPWKGGPLTNFPLRRVTPIIARVRLLFIYGSATNCTEPSSAVKTSFLGRLQPFYGSKLASTSLSIGQNQPEWLEVGLFDSSCELWAFHRVLI